MSNWTSFTADTLKKYILGGEYTAITTAGLAGGQSNPVPGTITETVNQARGKIAAGGYALEDGTDALPPEVHGAVAEIIRWRCLTRLNLKAFLSPERETTYKDALKLLDDVAKGTLRVTPAADGEEADPAPTAPVMQVSGAAKRFTRAQQWPAMAQDDE